MSKVVKGGSSGKGTALRGRSDADLVVFLNNLRSFREQYDRRAEFIREIRSQLEACQREQRFQVVFHINPHSNPRALSFVLKSQATGMQESVEFDILPAFNVLGQWTKGQSVDSQIYDQLIQECLDLRKEAEFSPCFTELQKAFLKERPTKLKSLIRLVKFWFQMCREDLGKPLPPQYALELLTVYAWEQGSGQTYFDTAQGFRTVLGLVLKYKRLCIFWEKYYSFGDPYFEKYLKRQLSKPRPVILDPADPTCNVAGGKKLAWQRLAQKVQIWLNYPCFKNWDGSPVRPWHVLPALETEYIDTPDVQLQFQGSRDHPAFSQSFIRVHPSCPPPEEESWSCSIL